MNTRPKNTAFTVGDYTVSVKWDSGYKRCPFCAAWCRSQGYHTHHRSCWARNKTKAPTAKPDWITRFYLLNDSTQKEIITALVDRDNRAHARGKAALCRAFEDKEALKVFRNEQRRMAGKKTKSRHPVPLSRTCDKHWAEMRKLPYREYLQTYTWEYTRSRALARADRRCQVCNSKNRLNVHHRTYENLGREKRGDVLVLCADCHALFHKHGKIV